MLDENVAPFRPSNVGAHCYHCPRTTCEGMHYVSSKDLGRELACPKCGLVITIAHEKGSARGRTRLWSVWNLVALLIGALTTFLFMLLLR